jgi:hypothetical protein
MESYVGLVVSLAATRRLANSRKKEKIQNITEDHDSCFFGGPIA